MIKESEKRQMNSELDRHSIEIALIKANNLHEEGKAQLMKEKASESFNRDFESARCRKAISIILAALERKGISFTSKEKEELAKFASYDEYLSTYGEEIDKRLK